MEIRAKERSLEEVFIYFTDKKKSEDFDKSKYIKDEIISKDSNKEYENKNLDNEENKDLNKNLDKNSNEELNDKKEENN